MWQFPNSPHSLVAKPSLSHQYPARTCLFPGEVKLPEGLQNLVFGMRFKQSLEGVTLPRSIKTLTLPDSWNQRLQNVVLPECLETRSSIRQRCFLGGLFVPLSHSQYPRNHLKTWIQTGTMIPSDEDFLFGRTAKSPGNLDVWA